MWSRYDQMQPSKLTDTDGEQWPDPLTTQYNNTRLTKIPTTKKITAADLDKFWLCNYREYGWVDHDDVWLSLNGVPYLTMLEPGDSIFKFDPSDINNYHNQTLMINE